MATTISNTTFSGTYKDDFLDSDNYHRILFNSGKALQARELTQSQTIINKEIERFGSNIFREGGAVNGGNLTVNNKVEFIKLAANQLPSNFGQIIGQEFTVQSPNPAVKVKILEVLHESGSDPETLIVEYRDTSAGTSSNTPIRVGNSNVLSNATLGSDFNMTTASSDAAGVGTKASITKGSFFVQGHFVFVAAQSIFVSKYSSTPTEDLGFLITEQVITSADDDALFDNQGASPNVASPGADRYRIRLSLTTRTIAGSDNFVYLGRIAAGRLADEITVTESYNSINNLLAQRTKEESGNYVAKPFNISFTNIDSASLKLHVSDGIAYVDGFRLELDERDITIPKATTTTTINGETASAAYGNYVLGYGNDLTGNNATLVNQGLPNIQTFGKVNLQSSTNNGGSKIGTARCRAIYRDGTGHYRFYLFDIRMIPGQSFASTRSFGTSGTDYVNIVTEGGQAVLKETSNNSLLFSLPRTRPAFDGVAGVQLIAQKHLTTGTAGSTSLSNIGGGALTTGVDAFFGGTTWVVSDTDSDIKPVSISGVGANFDISGVVSGQDHDVLAQVSMIGSTNMSQRAKTLTESTISKTWPTLADSDGSGFLFLSLDQPDIFAVRSVRLTDSSGADISTNFTLDNGQRDNYYGIGRLLPKSGVTIPSGTIFVRFQHFNHEDTLAGSLAGRRCYFDVTSYKNQTTPANGGAGVLFPGVEYDTIPDHTLADGTKVSLRDVLDFRPVATKKNAALVGSADFDITFDSDGDGSNPLIHLLPQPGANPSVNVTYFLPRKDRLVAATKDIRGRRIPTGELRYIQGTPSLTPELPPVPAGAMPLYNINLNPKTIDNRDLTTQMVNNKRFTMADIAALENRIDKIEEITTLSLLELNTSSLAVLDSSGNARTKAGFLVDNFADYSFTDLENLEQRAVINFEDGLIGPRNRPKATRFSYDSASGDTTTTRKADIALLPITNDAVSFIKQDKATTTENINPFAVIQSRGHIDLSPQTDTWVETEYLADNIVAGGTEFVDRNSIRSSSLSLWRNNWIGFPQGNRVLVRGRVTTRRDFVNDRVLDIEILPFMRSIKVFFRAQGLRRKTEHFPYFGNTDISNFARQEDSSAFTRFSTRTDDPGNTFTGNTAHPDGATNLTSDSAGKIIGSFIIPSTSTTKFNTGSQTFKLLDITGGVDSDAISTASATFQSTGILETRQRTFQEVRIEERFVVEEIVQRRDPLAQSFFVSDVENPNGLHITKVDVFFASKEDNFGVPVQCQIRRVENGVPTDRPISGAVKFLQPIEITNVVENTTSTTMSAVRAAPTSFIFDEPIYLTPGQEYAVVLLAESTAYSVYIAETYEFILGSSSERINKQPSLGSLFTSQNGSTWTPEQTKDLMFEIYRAQFSASGTALLKNATVPSQLLSLNPFATVAADSDVRVTHPGHGFAKGDAVTISGVSGAIATVADSNFNGSHIITAVDHTGYTFKTDSAPLSTLFGGGAAVIATQNNYIDTFVPQVQTMIAPNTSVTGQIKLSNATSYAGSVRRSATSGAGSTYSAGSFVDCQLNEINFLNAPGIVLSDSNQTTASLSPSANLKLTLTTNDTKVSPIIDLQRINLLGFENIIDHQDSASGITTLRNTPISIVEETDNQDGTSAAKHVTKPVVLEETAVGLKILFAANRPDAASFRVYFRTGTADDDLTAQTYTEVGQEGDNPPDDDKDTFREYEFLAGGQVGALSAFSKFQVKIVMNSSNSSKVPSIKDLRIIALVT